MKQTSLLEFESSTFAVVPGEDEETNPGIYGKALAQWIAEQLIALGFPAGEVIAEDFGWCVPVKSKSLHLYVACANVEGIVNRWRIFAFAEVGVLGRFFGKDTSIESLASLFAAVKKILQSTPIVQGLREEKLDAQYQ